LTVGRILFTCNVLALMKLTLSHEYSSREMARTMLQC